jgi:hypothetical protein
MHRRNSVKSSGCVVMTQGGGGRKLSGIPDAAALLVGV